jgi:hypothetical protein
MLPFLIFPTQPDSLLSHPGCCINTLFLFVTEVKDPYYGMDSNLFNHWRTSGFSFLTIINDLIYKHLWTNFCVNVSFISFCFCFLLFQVSQWSVGQPGILCVVQAGLKFTILLLPPIENWNYKHMLLCPACLHFWDKCLPMGTIASLYGSCMFSFWNNYQTIFQNVCIILHSYHICIT